jgi:hypothetical protein
MHYAREEGMFPPVIQGDGSTLVVCAGVNAFRINPATR